MHRTIDVEIKIGDIEKIFGISSYQNILDSFILATKQVFYKKMIINKIYDLWDSKRVLIKQMLSEEYNTTDFH